MNPIFTRLESDTLPPPTLGPRLAAVRAEIAKFPADYIPRTWTMAAIYNELRHRERMLIEQIRKGDEKP